MARRLIDLAEQHAQTILLVLMLIGLFAAFLVAFLWIGIPRKTKGTIMAGVTFSQIYAQDLGLNWREALTSSLDELGVRHFRIPVYWKIVEPEEGRFEWQSIDYQMDEIGKRGGHVILAIGAKLPRWPECWIPDWATLHGITGEREARLKYMDETVKRYKDHPALDSWQVENEALFPFGLCPKPSRVFLKQEIQRVRSQDIVHPIVTTDSGELSTWLQTAPLVDRLGISVYRVVTTYFGIVWKYTFIPPYWYARHALLVSPLSDGVFVSEFQMEPWAQDSLAVTPISEQFRTFNPEQMDANFRFAERMRIREIYFWGVEWWYWMKTKQNDDRFWMQAKSFWQKHSIE